MNDQDSLSALLKTWRHQPREAPEFNRGVWARIQEQSATEHVGVIRRLLYFPLTSAMPMAASLLLLLSLAAGSGAAFAYNSITRDDRMATEYARSIDPLQMTAANSHT